MVQSQEIKEDRILKQLEAQGRSWRDYVLVGDPPAIVSGGREGTTVLLIEDDELANAAVALLTRRGARRFQDLDELKAATGWDGDAHPSNHE